jgi:hypothetical protein
MGGPRGARIVVSSTYLLLHICDRKVMWMGRRLKLVKIKRGEWQRRDK